MIKYLYLILVLLLWGCVADNNPEPEDVFVKYYGEGSNQAVDLVRVQDANSGQEQFIILASNRLEGEDLDFYIIKTDNEGNQIRSSLYNVFSDSVGTESDDFPHRIKYIGNNQLLLVGHAVTQNADGVDIFNGVWGIVDLTDLSLVGGDSVGGFNVIPDVITVDILKPNDQDEVVILGHTTNSLDDVNDGLFQIYQAKYDLNNNVIWENTHGFAGNDQATAMFQNSDGTFLIVGSTESSSGSFSGQNIYALQTTDRGTAQGNGIRFGISDADDNADDVPKSVISIGLDYVVVGTTEVDGQSAGFRIDLNESADLKNSGEVLQTDFNNQPCQALAVTKTRLGELMVFGSFDSGASEALEQILVMRVLAIEGHMTGYDQSYGTTVGNDRANAAITLPNDGDLLVASTIDFGSGTTLIGLLRLNERGELRD